MLHGFPGPHSFGGSRLPASHSAYFLAVQSADRATPGNQPQFDSTETPARRTRNRRGPRRRWRPCRSVARPVAGPDRDRAGVDIAVVDVPAFLAGVSRSAAAEFGHAPLKRDRGRQANRPCGMCGSRNVGRGGRLAIISPATKRLTSP
jgi:hypothetical protein